MPRLWDDVKAFRAAMPLACTTTAMDPRECLTDQQVDGDDGGTTTTLGCWYDNSCRDTYGNTRVPYRRPRSVSDDTNTYHEGIILRDAVSFVAGYIRRNAFAPTADMLPEANNYNQTPGGWFALASWSVMVKKLDLINYTVRRYYDANMDRELIAIEPINWKQGPDAGGRTSSPLHSTLRETVSSGGRNWGRFIFNTRPSSYTVIEVPHMRADLNSERMGTEAFEKGDAFALFIAGVPRAVFNRADRDWTRNSPYEVVGKGDVAHEQHQRNPTLTGSCGWTSTSGANRCMTDSPGTNLSSTPERGYRSGFQWAHVGLTDGLGDDGRPLGGRVNMHFIQFHGFNDSPTGKHSEYSASGSYPTQVVLSPGPRSASITDLGMANAAPLIAAISNAATDPKKIDGTTASVTARLAQGGTGYGLTATANVQGKDAIGHGLFFIHAEVNGAVRMVGGSDDESNTDQAGDDYNSSSPPDLPNLVARKIIYAYQDWMADMSFGSVKPPLRSSAAWLCDKSVYFGADKDTYVDKRPPFFTGPAEIQTQKQSAPFDATFLAQAHRSGLKFAMYHLDSPNLIRPSSTTADWYGRAPTGCNNNGKNLDPALAETWHGHREQLERAGLMVFPIYMAPIPCIGASTGGTLTCPGTKDATGAVMDCGSDTYAHEDFPTAVTGHDGAAEAADARSRAITEGFRDGTALFLDVESSDHPYFDDAGSHSFYNLREYVGAWVEAMKNSSGPHYRPGIYCSNNNCDWIKYFLASDKGIATTDVEWWVHDAACDGHGADLCLDEECSDTTHVTVAGAKGCFQPSKSDGDYGAMVPYFAPNLSGIGYANLWQYATSDDSAPDGCGFGSATIASSDGYFGTSGSPAHGFLSDGPAVQCTLRQVGDYAKYSSFVDMSSMANHCTSGVPDHTIPVAIGPKKFFFNPRSLTSDATTLSNFLNNPNTYTLSSTATTLGLEQAYLVNWQSLYSAGGARIYDNMLVDNVDYAESPTPSNPIANPNFEAGTTTGWTSTGTTSAPVYQTSWSGFYLGQIGMTTSQTLDSRLSQTFTVPVGYKSLSFYYQPKCSDLSVSYDQFRVKLRDETTATDYTLVPDVCSNDGKWHHFEYPLAGLEGHSLTLKFETHDDGVGNYPTYAWIDEVVLSTIGNGAFEASTTLNQWTSTGVTAAYSNANETDPSLGAAAARVGSTGPYTNSSLSQTVVVPSWGVSSLMLRRKIVCLDSLSWAWAWITLTDNDTGLSYTMMSNTCTNNGAWENSSYSIAAMAGHSVTIRVDVHDDNNPGDPIYMLIDRVRFE
jgi:hypothetical protein